MAFPVDRKNRLLLLLLAGLILGFVAWYFAGHPDEKGSFQDFPVEMELQDFELIHGSKGRKSWKLKARTSRYHKEKDRITLIQPYFVFFRSKEDSSIRVSAAEGRLEKQKGTILLWPRVTAVYEQTRLTADRMEYNDSYRELVFYGKVEIEYPGMRVRSQNGVFDLESKTLTLWGDVLVLLKQEGPRGQSEEWVPKK